MMQKVQKRSQPSWTFRKARVRPAKVRAPKVETARSRRAAGGRPWSPSRRRPPCSGGWRCGPVSLPRSLRERLRDPAAAEDGVAAVEDGRLPGCDGRSVALEEDHRIRPVRAREPRPDRRVAVPDADGERRVRGRGRPARPRHLARDQPAGAKPRRVAHRDGRRARIERPDISADTAAGREPEPAALAYGEAVHARVPPELAPGT